MGIITEAFGANVFNDSVMKARLPRDVYKALRKTMELGVPLDISVANTVAAAMKEWAVSLGCTHFTHWFQPLTAVTAEKHDSFLSPLGGVTALESLSGKMLVQGEPDASSFPSGGLRATCSARGYSVWDPTSYAFVKNSCLYIPACFVSYTGEALDRKVPLLRSIEALSKQGIRVLRLCGNKEAYEIKTTAGPEQEYFLIPKELYEQRKDLVYTGRTLFGAKPPRGQELDDQYFGSIRAEVKSFMEDVNVELWKLGINATTEHNEVAPCQHELAPIFSTTNLSNDTNMLAMTVMQEVAKKHGLVCLLHEKPFAGVNGSGKHNNWSLATDLGENLLDPTDDPYNNTQFLLFLAAAIRAVSKYSELMRISVASAGNDHRLGANEAPPAIVSIYLGDELNSIVDAIATGKKYVAPKKSKMSVGVPAIPLIKKDATDRNRTSSFAFTGNKFEFRMAASSQSIADPNTVLNTIMAEVLGEFADKLEKKSDFEASARKLIREIFKEEREHIIFNGNGYSEEWTVEAAKRGLPNLKTTPDALACYDKPEYIKLFEKNNVMTEAEVKCRKEVGFENYVTILSIEAKTMIEMAMKQIIPSCLSYASELQLADGEAAGIIKEQVTSLTDQLYQATEALKASLAALSNVEGAQAQAFYVKDNLKAAMEAVRQPADTLETLVSKDYWPFPTYGDILYY
jgi:glutamine synthetase